MKHRLDISLVWQPLLFRLLAGEVEVRFHHPDGDVSGSASLARQPLCGAAPDGAGIHCVDQGILDLLTVVIPPLRLFRFRPERRHYDPFTFLRHTQNPFPAR